MIHFRPLPNVRKSALLSIARETHRKLREELRRPDPDKIERKRNASHEFHQRGETAE